MISRKKFNSWIDTRALSLYALATLMCILAGQLVPIGGPKVSILFIAAVAGIFLVMQPLVLLWLATIVTLVIAGMTVYFAKGLNLTWGGYGLAGMLFGATILVAFNESIRSPRGRQRRDVETAYAGDHGALSVSTAFIVFVAIALITVFVNQPPIWQTVAAVKSYFLYGGVWTALAFACLKKDVVQTWMKGLLIIALIQWPVALYQYLFVRSARIIGGLGSVEASDSVVGTFGGSQESGGLTAALAIYLVVVLTILWGLYRDRVLTGRRFALLACFAAFPLVLMEVKIVFFYLPVALFFLYRDLVYKRPMVMLGGGAAVALTLASLLVAYQYFHWSARSDDMEDNLLRSFTYSFDEDLAERMRKRGSLTRRSAIEFWLAENTKGDHLRLLIGHGLGATRYTDFTSGHIAEKYYPLNTTLTGLSVLLWETGVLGVLAFCFILFCAFRSAGQLMKSTALDDWQRGLARGLQAGIPLYVMSLAYRPDIPLAGPMMMLFMGHLGLIAWLQYQRRVNAEQ